MATRVIRLSKAITAERTTDGARLVFDSGEEFFTMHLEENRMMTLMLWWLENLIGMGFHLERDEEYNEN